MHAVDMRSSSGAGHAAVQASPSSPYFWCGPTSSIGSTLKGTHLRKKDIDTDTWHILGSAQEDAQRFERSALLIGHRLSDPRRCRL
eukprot:826625-Pleurochrysis_carterae.AAC.4